MNPNKRNLVNESLRLEIARLTTKVLQQSHQLAEYNMVLRENAELRRRQEWLERRVNELELSDVARV